MKMKFGFVATPGCPVMSPPLLRPNQSDRGYLNSAFRFRRTLPGFLGRPAALATARITKFAMRLGGTRVHPGHGFEGSKTETTLLGHETKSESRTMRAISQRRWVRVIKAL